MPPYLKTVRSFADVPQSDAGIETLPFLEAARGLVGIFDLLNSLSLAPVSKDMTANIASHQLYGYAADRSQKVQTRYDEAPEKSATLEELVQNEVAEKRITATEGLLWLTRGLRFTCNALQDTQKTESLELSQAFKNAYETSLKPHHGFLARSAFSAAMMACPKRDLLYSKLKEDNTSEVSISQDDLDESMNIWLAALTEIVQRIKTFYDNNKFKNEKGKEWYTDL